jgi:polar amino acid transport system substrate-binding protein
MAIHQAMGLATSRGSEAFSYLKDFVEEMKSSGFVAQALARHQIQGALVAPAGYPPA